MIDIPTRQAGDFPADLVQLSVDRIQLNRLLGLSNLYYIDPEDQEILAELCQVRLRLIEGILACPESELQRLMSTDLGDRYWALVRSGIQQEPLTPVEEQKKHLVTQKLNPTLGGGFSTPGAVNAFLVAMTLYLPGTMKVDDASSKLPDWIFKNYDSIFAVPSSQSPA